ncbi:hybrid sensor histidine kinase/response regulator [Phormidium tenue FACHB-886]|nr:hybrid sensor histidine kinase/response regulator [Phormidium tenue FACHB-886]
MSLQSDSKPDRILAVDDAPDNLFLIQTLLKNSGYEVSLAEDGKSALAQIEAAPPDLILLDVMMPEMDGYEVTRCIRQNTNLPFIPILLITAHQRSSVVEGLDAGADDFIRKPLDVDELLARVRALLRLKHSTDAQAQMLRQREDFVSRLTHDLRTPLVALDRMMELILQNAFGDISSDLQAVINSMVGSNQNLLRMVNTLLEVYRHEAGRKVLTYSSCNLQELIHEVTQELKPLASERGIDLILEPNLNSLKSKTNGAEADAASEDLPITVMADYQELRRVLTNLIGNAIKFTETGYVKIRLTNILDKSLDQSIPSPSVAIEIEDTGVGISPEDQVTLFERFHHGQHKRSGSGLGLYLSQRIVEAHQGVIQVQSEPKQGSVFTIRLPMFPSVAVEQGYQMTLV